MDRQKRMLWPCRFFALLGGVTNEPADMSFWRGSIRVEILLIDQISLHFWKLLSFLIQKIFAEIFTYYGDDADYDDNNVIWHSYQTQRKILFYKFMSGNFICEQEVWLSFREQQLYDKIRADHADGRRLLMNKLLRSGRWNDLTQNVLMELF